ncbi:MAG: peptidase U35, partial [bacterium]
MANEILTRTAAFEPSTYDTEKRTVQVVFSTGADVQRSDFEGPYIERLSMDPSAVDLSHLIGGPVLDNHDRFSSVRSV